MKVNINSARAIKSRYAKKINNKKFSLGFYGAGLLSLFGGLALLYLENKLAGIVLVPAIFTMMAYIWDKGELSRLEELTDEFGLEGKLDPAILAGIKNDSQSAYAIWQAAKDTPARWFFQNRYMLHPVIFDEYLSREPGTAEQIWDIANDLQKQYQRPDLPASIVLVALLKSIPGVDDMLRRIKLDLNEVEEGINWISSIESKRKLARQKQHYGGLARDWAYGYTPILRYLGRNITEEVQFQGFYIDTKPHNQIVDQMINAMGSGTSSITLVGEIGVGKTTCIHALANRLIEDRNVSKSMKFRQIVALDAPSLLAQTKTPGELEGLLIKIINEAQRAKNIMLFFDDAHVFFGQGSGSVDLSNTLQQVLDSGSLKIIFALTPRQWQQIGANNPAIASKLKPLQVPAAGEPETIHILRDQVLFIEHKRGVLFTQQALKEAYRLGSRYVDNQAMPGAALNVLEAAAPVASDGYVTPEVVQQSIESTFGVKIQQSSGDESQTLLHLEDELHKYVINQKQAVSVIANALRRSRSGVGNPERPVGTFLFLGPTGVGKTELSKALAKVYFGDETSIIRADMNQFVSPEDIKRLITPILGEQLGLLGQIRRRPFSVILLDEIEKAHKSVINLLLQMLDEGVMRDVDNKPVSFKDAIIIATSNAGADRIRKAIDEKQDLVGLQGQLVDHIIEQQIFTPEFVNRFDEVVIFRPLTQEELIQVIDLIIAGINRTLDKQKVQVELSEPAKKWLVEKGYDAKLGARPMRRVVQKYVENILARRLLERSVDSGSSIKLDVADFEALGES
ncbi:ATP-dependent Clp protease ATP-binding subunit [Candidatus Parcubacteria bacterium]|nr:ATP-dependent Clp protease ATP-binding subunit [Candidatus Parcubacteria bacterium]